MEPLSGFGALAALKGSAIVTIVNAATSSMEKWNFFNFLFPPYYLGRATLARNTVTAKGNTLRLLRKAVGFIQDHP
jgi:hypothetical protein